MNIWNILGIIVGFTLCIFAGYDDSPGGQVIGGVIVLFFAVQFIRNLNQKDK